MYMVRNAVNDDGFLVFVFDDARHIFKNLLAPRFLQEVLSAFYGKNVLYVDL
jgi:hypothetical protein